MLEKIKKFVKSTWFWVLLAPSVFVAFIIAFWRNRGNLFELMQDIRASGKKEVEDIKKIREEELQSQSEADKLFERRMKKVEEDFAKEKKEFDEKKKNEVEQLLISTKSDPVKLAEELSKVTGFKIIFPEE